MYFYKYCRPGELQFAMLRRGEIFFASPDELNDGSECRTRMILKGSLDLWVKLSEFVLREAWFGASYTPSKVSQEIAQLSKIAEGLAKSLMKRIGRRDLEIGSLATLLEEELPQHLSAVETTLPPEVLVILAKNFVNQKLPELLIEPRYIASFSRSPNNPTMWGHYAGAERGYSIVFSTNNSSLTLRSPLRLFCGTRPHETESGVECLEIISDGSVKLRAVDYNPKPPKLNAFHTLVPHFFYSEAEDHYDVPSNIAAEAPEKEGDKLGFIKAPSWRYEQEERALFPTFGTFSSDARTLEVAWEHICGVIFGPKMSDEDKRRVVGSCFALRAHRRGEVDTRDLPFVFFEAQQQVGHYEFQLKVVGILGEHYGEGFLPFMPFRTLESSVQVQLESILEGMSK